MKGHTAIGNILQTEYGVKDLTPYEEIEYEIERCCQCGKQIQRID